MPRLRFPPMSDLTRKGIRTLSLPPDAIAILRYDTYDSIFFKVTTESGDFIAGDRDLPQLAQETNNPARGYARYHGESVRLVTYRAKGANGHPRCLGRGDLAQKRSHALADPGDLPGCGYLVSSVSCWRSSGLVCASRWDRCEAWRHRFPALRARPDTVAARISSNRDRRPGHGVESTVCDCACNQRCAKALSRERGSPIAHTIDRPAGPTRAPDRGPFRGTRKGAPRAAARSHATADSHHAATVGARPFRRSSQSALGIHPDRVVRHR